MILSNTGLNQNEFAEKVGIHSSSVRNYLSGTKAQTSVIGKIIAAFPEYNKDWIALGRGPMLVGGPEPTDTYGAQKVTPNEPQGLTLYERMFELLNAQISQKDVEIQRLLNILDRQSQSLAKFEASPEGTGEMTLSRGDLDTEGLAEAA